MPKILCGCGSNIKHTGLVAHLKTKKHHAFLNKGSVTIGKKRTHSVAEIKTAPRRRKAVVKAPKTIKIYSRIGPHLPSANSKFFVGPKPKRAVMIGPRRAPKQKTIKIYTKIGPHLPSANSKFFVGHRLQRKKRTPKTKTVNVNKKRSHSMAEIVIVRRKKAAKSA